MSYKLEYKTISFGLDPTTRQPTQGIAGNFYIPSYQRGYRWTKDEVTKLLDDIWESGGEPYSLQPIVVKGLGSGSWELIDGQQRLTTLWILLRFMQKGTIPYSLEYETRPESLTYLQNIDAGRSTDNIDFFHIYQAYATIAAWFVNKMGAPYQQFLIDEMFRFLSTSVRIIWYEVPEAEKPIPLFTRLNQGRIPLTDSELIKAVLLANIEKVKSGRETEVAAQWDGIERDLQRDDIWAFVASRNYHDHTRGTRIDLLLDTLAKKPATGARRYHTFDALQNEAQASSLEFWKKIVALHAQIMGWFEEPRWHNKIGFLVACGKSLGDILLLSQGQGKQAFEKALVVRINETLNIKADDLGDLSYENSSAKTTLQRLLLLFNVEICRERFPFKEHVDTRWSLEHVHAQNAQDLTRAEQWQVWLQEHENALQTIRSGSNDTEIDSLTDEIGEATQRLADSQFRREQFNDLSGRIQRTLSGGLLAEADHGIRNLALLSHGANAALSNAVFEVKRQKVLEMDKRGDYIPMATRNVFLKYYSPADRLQLHFWSPADKDAYFLAIKDTLNKAGYLK
ncbi:DUF262 domain-containing protein [Extensimonas sp. H3M7-6]|uniref:DUF262 domain-containing protein n=1 Tax=Extensimonas soli TaxID=3031322 RepID=UPI0023DCB6E9|nr:DUF262 domain-containing protein [Extensimonas sp. H3M7-6]